MSGGGTEYRLMWQVRLMVLPALTYTADSPVRDALAAGKKRINWRSLVKKELYKEQFRFNVKTNI